MKIRNKIRTKTEHSVHIVLTFIEPFRDRLVQIIYKQTTDQMGWSVSEALVLANEEARDSMISRVIYYLSNTLFAMHLLLLNI